MKNLFRNLTAIALLSSSASVFAAEGHIKVHNNAGYGIDVMITHVGCSGVVDAVLTTCSELPHGHKGYTKGLGNGAAHTFVLEEMGSAHGYGVVGTRSATSEKITCYASISKSAPANIYFSIKGGHFACNH